MKTHDNSQNHSLLVKVEKAIYSHEVILKAAYKYTGKCYLQINSIDGQHFGVHFKPKNGEIDLKSIVDEFQNELIDQQVRYMLDTSNRKIKELIVRKAFSHFEQDEP